MLNRASHVAILILILLLLSPILSFAQKEGNVWYFGVRGGLDFNTLPPRVLTDGKIETREGVATVSDANGNLLFYTSGKIVYNASHTVMPNGDNLLGNPSSNQSAIAVPYPGNPGKYFLFTTSVEHGMYYSLIDMSLDEGKGDIVTASKNILLLTENYSTESLVATKHCNNMDLWVITHTKYDNKFHVYPITSAGVGQAQEYAIGSVVSNDGWEMSGVIKLSPDSKKLAHTFGNVLLDGTANTEVLSFDNSTGAINGPITVLGDINMPYGAEFSPDGNMLYISTNSGKSIFQYNMNEPDINASRYPVIESSNLRFGALQLAIDGKIYASAENGYDIPYSYIGIINNPNIYGGECNYVQDAINLSPGGALMGLPTLMASYFYNPEIFLVKDTCFGSATSFSVSNTTGITSVSWSFGDGSSSSSFNPSHTYAASGPYNVTLAVSGPCYTATFSRDVYIMEPDQVSEEKYICTGSDYTLPDGRIVNTPGDYISTLKNIHGCDSIITTKLVTVEPYNGSEEVEICTGSSYTLPDGRTISVAGTYTSTFLTWQKCDSIITTTLRVVQDYHITEKATICAGQDFTLPNGKVVNVTGTYTSSLLSVGGCDSIITTILKEAPSYISNDQQEICSGETYTLQDGTQITQTGNYTVKYITYLGCDSIFNTHVQVNHSPIIDLGADTCLFNNKPIIVSPGPGFNSYRWQNGATTSIFTIYQPGIYWVEVSNDCGTSRDVIQTSVCSPDIFVPNAFTPNGDGLNDIFRIVNYHGQQLQDFSIFNRWGELIYHTTNPAAGWNGTYRNVPQPIGSYVYMIRYLNMDGIQRLLKGTITLTR
ncbi:gliding motility-associated C-terminal domain-containing protein [Chitinophaga sp. MM2321]|uniref:gliding motility-associated C-terminal domain-containing protein n=1 Tax=Chitinophaga sp. MM2321 TaxID=3137178 RepID=UPI0032D5A740